MNSDIQIAATNDSSWSLWFQQNRPGYAGLVLNNKKISFGNTSDASNHQFISYEIRVFGGCQ